MTETVIKLKNVNKKFEIFMNYNLKLIGIVIKMDIYYIS